jgi:hypothetical protein
MGLLFYQASDNAFAAIEFDQVAITQPLAGSGE